MKIRRFSPTLLVAATAVIVPVSAADGLEEMGYFDLEGRLGEDLPT
ncbi:MAG: hypothetical protein GY895_15300, partial [Phycisphaera sp.]|nr:hypothetical protein [Phycisphaera sp.]